MSSTLTTKTAPRKHPEQNVGESGSRTARRIILIGLVLAVGFVLGARLFGLKAELAETNYQANLIRLQDFMYGTQPKMVLVGSSITGRILPSYFEQTSFKPVRNLGLDGSGPPLGLLFCVSKPAPIVVVEVNTILKEWDRNDETLQAATRNPSFRLARYLPFLRAGSRPSSILYSLLKTRRNVESVTAQEPRKTGSEQVKPQGVKAPIRTASAELVEKSVVRLQAAGCKVVLANIPTGPRFAGGASPAMIFAKDLSQRLNIPFVDIQAECERLNRTLSYTDGLHLTPAAAREVADVLSRTVSNLAPAS